MLRSMVRSHHFLRNTLYILNPLHDEFRSFFDGHISALGTSQNGVAGRSRANGERVVRRKLEKKEEEQERENHNKGGGYVAEQFREGVEGFLRQC